MKEKKTRNKTIVHTLNIGVLIIVLFVGIIIGYFNMIYKARRNEMIKDCRISASRSVSSFEKYLSTNIDMINFTAYTLDEMLLQNRSSAEIQAFLVGQSTAIRNAVLENSTGLYGYIKGEFHSGTNWVPPADYDAKARPWYTNAMASPGELTILEPYFDVQSGNTMLALGKSLCDGESVISVDVSFGQIQKITEEAAIADSGEDIEMILTGEGTVVTHSDPGEVGKNYIEEDGTLGSAIIDRLASSDDSSFEFEHQGHKYIVYDAVFQDDWHFVSLQDATEMSRSLTRILLVTILIVVSVISIMGIILVKSVKLDLRAEKAVAANAAKTDFLARMSHEIRTPINAMIGMNEMILRESDDAKILSYSEKAREAGKNLLEMVDDILVYSRIDLKDTDGASSEISKSSIDGKGDMVRRIYAPGARVLAIDDTPMNLTVFINLLSHTGMQIDTAESADEGLKLTREKTYDIMFFDHMMPVKDGIEALHELRSQEDNPNLHTPVICLTANATAGAKEMYLREGFDAYISKPLDGDRLEETFISFLPVDKIKEITTEKRVTKETPYEVPEELMPLEGDERIEIFEGLKNSGSFEAYLPLLRIFYSSIDEKSKELRQYYEEGRWNDYTIKVHAIKSSARIIGALSLGDMAEALEGYGKSGEIERLRLYHEDFMKLFESFSDLLAPIFTDESDEEKPEADMELIESAYDEFRAAADDMDCDRLMEIFDTMSDYRIPDSEKDLWKSLKDACTKYDYDAVLELLS